MKEEDEHNRGGTTSSGGRVKDKIDEDEDKKDEESEDEEEVEAEYQNCCRLIPFRTLIIRYLDETLEILWMSSKN